ncbi:hypothetical protein F4778DRAFT_769385 [Xylariomycetidae sp. FL2044]|nr:hypothetical protein F4778DRAFT_769385 [Xylariomycetidae sp. FL2044]
MDSHRRYQSRIFREMHQNTENPFNSPPSSTGSHGTVTLDSEFSHIPEGESTRRANDSSIQLPPQSTKSPSKYPPNVNTSVLGRTFPEWKDWDRHSNQDTRESHKWDTAADMSNLKENIPPHSPNTSKARSTTRNAHLTRAQMQPTVHSDDDDSSILSASSWRRISVKSDVAKEKKSRRGNVTTLLDTLKTAQTKQPESREASPKTTISSNQHSNVRVPTPTQNLHSMRSLDPNQTALSFILPTTTLLNDFVSGALRWSSTENGVPIFVKHGKVHDQETRVAPGAHAEVEAIAIPQDEQKIFVSMDNIREEIRALREHDVVVTKRAEVLQDEIQDLHSQFARYKSRKDSAMGSDSESSMIEHINAQNTELKTQVATLQARLDKANRKISISEIHTDSYVAERDKALKSMSEYIDENNRLQTDLDFVRQQLKQARRDEHQGDTQAEDVEKLRVDNNTLRKEHQSAVRENQSLQRLNRELAQDLSEVEQESKVAKLQLDLANEESEEMRRTEAELKADVASLESRNQKLLKTNESVQQKNSVLNLQIRELQQEVARLKGLLDAMNDDNGTMSINVKDLRNQMDSQARELKRQLSKVNAESQQQIIDLQQEKRRLVTTNQRLTDQLAKIQEEFDQIVKDSQETTMKRDQRSQKKRDRQDLLEMELDLRRQLDRQTRAVLKSRQRLDEMRPLDVTVTESLYEGTVQGLKGALRALDETKDTNASTSKFIHERAMQAIERLEEARELFEEVKTFNNTSSSKSKQRKVTRIIDPKGNSVPRETSAKSSTSQTDMPMQDDYTRQIDFTQGSDFARELAENGILGARRLPPRKTSETLPNNVTEGSMDFDGGVTEEMSQILPPLSPVNEVVDEPSTSKRIIETVEEDDEEDDDHGMTSAFFMDDITVDTKKQATQNATRDTTHKTTKETMSASAKRVLDNLCHDHECRNCMVCTRVLAHGRSENGKRQILHVKPPTPVTDRVPNVTSAASGYEDGPTMRPSQDPYAALVKLHKHLKDEEVHLKLAIDNKQADYEGHTASFGRSSWKKLGAEIDELRRKRNVKWDQLYYLADALEGFKDKRQMSQETVDITITEVQRLGRDCIVDF